MTQQRIEASGKAEYFEILPLSLLIPPCRLEAFVMEGGGPLLPLEHRENHMYKVLNIFLFTMASPSVMPKSQENQIKTQWSCGILAHREVSSYIGSHGEGAAFPERDGMLGNQKETRSNTGNGGGSKLETMLPN